MVATSNGAKFTINMNSSNSSYEDFSRYCLYSNQKFTEVRLAMKAILFRTASMPVQPPVRSSSLASLKVFVSRQDSGSGIFSGERHSVSSPRVSMNLEMNNKRVSGIRRALSQSDVSRLEVSTKLSGGGSRFAPSRIPEEDVNGIGNDRVNHGGIWPNNGGDNSDDKRKMGDYYRELVKSNPTDPLILRNYGKFLYEVSI